ncbi:MAG: hypothetical protein OHK0015_03430 [Chloroflexi bacterium OHK40]
MHYNAGLIVSAGSAALIDPGPHPDDVAAAADLAASLGARVELVLLTHSHWDHILGPERLPGVPVAAHTSFAATLAAQQEPTLRMIGRWEQRFGYGREAPFTPPVITTLLGDGASLTVGDLAFQAIHIPGHAADQLALFEPASGALWAADTLSDVEIPFVSDSLDAYEQSLARLARLPMRALVPGHGNPTDDPTAIVERLSADRAYLAELRERVAAVLRAGGSLEMAVERCAGMLFREPAANAAPHRLNIESVYIELGGQADPARVGWVQEGLIDE